MSGRVGRDSSEVLRVTRRTSCCVLTDDPWWSPVITSRWVWGQRSRFRHLMKPSKKAKRSNNSHIITQVTFVKLSSINIVCILIGSLYWLILFINSKSLRPTHFTPACLLVYLCVNRDDTQLFNSFRAPEFSVRIYTYKIRLIMVSQWMSANLLSLNQSKLSFVLLVYLFNYLKSLILLF